MSLTISGKAALRGGVVAIAALFSADPLASAAVVELVPTGTPADVTNLAAALASASDGDVIFLRARDAQDEFASFDLSTMSSSEFVVSAPNVTVSGEAEMRSRRVRTSVVGPTTFDLDESFVAFDVQPSADGFMATGILFRRFEAVMLLRAGAKNASLVDCTLINCANGVFGIGDNDGLTIESSSIRIAATPVGGNAAVTVQEGSDDVRVANCVVIGPGIDAAPLAAAGIMDFNIDSPAARLNAFNNTIQRCDVGIYVSGASPRLVRNTVSRCRDGVAAVSEIGTGSTQGTQTVTNALVRNNSSRMNSNDGILLIGVDSALVAFNSLNPNLGAGVSCGASSMSTSSAGVVLTGNSGTESCGGSLVIESETPRRTVRPVRP